MDVMNDSDGDGGGRNKVSNDRQDVTEAEGVETAPVEIHGNVVSDNDDDDDDWAAPVHTAKKTTRNGRQQNGESSDGTTNLTDSAAFKRVTRRRTLDKTQLRQLTLAPKQVPNERSRDLNTAATDTETNAATVSLGRPAQDPAEGQGTNNDSNESRAMENKIVEVGLQMGGSTLRCPACGKAGSLVKNGTTRAGAQAIRCMTCRKQLSGQNISGMLAAQLGETWKLEAIRVLHGKDRSNNSSAQNGNGTITVARTTWAVLIDQVATLTATVEALKTRTAPITLETQQQTAVSNGNDTQVNSLRSELSTLKAEHNALKKTLEETLKRVDSQSSRDNARIQQSHGQPTQGGTIEQDGEAAMEVETATPTPTRLRNEADRQTIAQGNRPHEPTANETAGPETRKWSKVASAYRPQVRKSAEQRPTSRPGEGLTWAERLAKSRDMLSKNNLRVEKKPQPVAVYFKGIRRGPLGQVRGALRQSLSNWALLDLCFIGSAVLEVITDKGQRSRLVDTMKQLGITEVTNFDVIGDAMKARREQETDTEMLRKNIEKSVTRMTRCAEISKSSAAKGYYLETVNKAKAKLAELKEKSSDDNESRVEEGQVTEAAQNGNHQAVETQQARETERQVEDANPPTRTTPGVVAEGSAIPAKTNQEGASVDSEMVENAPENETEETAESNATNENTDPKGATHAQ